MELPHTLAPVPFGGLGTESAEVWLARFENYAKFNSWNENQNLLAFSLFLTKHAEIWYQFLTADQSLDYATVKQHFMKQYFKMEQSDTVGQVLQELKHQQQADETVSDYITRTKLACIHLGKCATPDFRKYTLVSGLRPQVRAQVDMREPSTEHDVEKLARTAEHAEQYQISERAQQVNIGEQQPDQEGDISATQQLQDSVTSNTNKTADECDEHCEGRCDHYSGQYQSVDSIDNQGYINESTGDRQGFISHCTCNDQGYVNYDRCTSRFHGYNTAGIINQQHGVQRRQSSVLDDPCKQARVCGNQSDQARVCSN
jgi:hypothetical protein